MAIVTGLNIPPDLEDPFRKNLKTGERFTYNRVDRKAIIWRKRNLKEIQARSKMGQVVILWNNLSDANKTLWNTAGSHCGLTGYRLFLQDTVYRLENNLSGLATPNNNHQYKVFQLEVAPGTTEFWAYQNHFNVTRVLQRAPGQKEAYNWVEVTEPLVNSILLEFDYWADLEYWGSNQFFDVYVVFYGTKGGSSDYDYFQWDLDLQAGWQRFSQSMTSALDTINQYTLVIEGFDIQGTLRVDNVNLEHGGQNWAINPNCDRIRKKMYDYFGIGWFPWRFHNVGDYLNYDSVYIN